MKNAILMAAGMGTRMHPLTEKIPKPLVAVAGKPMIETVIEALESIKIEHIYIVTGYLGEQFTYLKEKYGNVSILINPDYKVVNNISSIYTARNALKMGDCFICEADLYISNYAFLHREWDHSGYFGKYVEGHSEDWVFDCDGDGYITRVGKIGDDCYNMVGIAYFKETEASRLADMIENTYYQIGYEYLFWDDVVNAHLKELKLVIHPVDKEAIVEIDTLEELEEVNEKITLRGVE